MDGEADCGPNAGFYCVYNYDGYKLPKPDTPAKRLALMKTLSDTLVKLKNDHYENEEWVTKCSWLSEAERKSKVAMMKWLEEEIGKLLKRIDWLQDKIEKDSPAT